MSDVGGGELAQTIILLPSLRTDLRGAGWLSDMCLEGSSPQRADATCPPGAGTHRVTPGAQGKWWKGWARLGGYRGWYSSSLPPATCSGEARRMSRGRSSCPRGAGARDDLGVSTRPPAEPLDAILRLAP